MLKLLRTMTKNKIFDHIRKKNIWKGGGKFTELSAEVIDGLSREVLTPAEFAAIKELAEKVWECMPPRLSGVISNADLREDALGQNWSSAEKRL